MSKNKSIKNENFILMKKISEYIETGKNITLTKMCDHKDKLFYRGGCIDDNSTRDDFHLVICKNCHKIWNETVYNSFCSIV